MQTNTSTKRTRVEYTAQFATILADLSTNQSRLSERITGLEEHIAQIEKTLNVFLRKQAEVMQARNRFVTWGIAIAVLTSIISVLISILR